MKLFSSDTKINQNIKKMKMIYNITMSLSNYI